MDERQGEDYVSIDALSTVLKPETDVKGGLYVPDATERPVFRKPPERRSNLGMLWLRVIEFNFLVKLDVGFCFLGFVMILIIDVEINLALYYSSSAQILI